MWSYPISSTNKKRFKRLDIEIKDLIKTKYVQDILLNPDIGESLVGDLKGILSFHFKIGKQHYRIAYIVDDDLKTVYFLMIGKRGDFYSILRRRIK